MRKIIPLSFTLLILAFLGSCGPDEQADLLIYNATVYTVNDQFSVSEAIVIRQGMIIDVGRVEEMRKKYWFSREEDLRGYYIYPGFIDAHAHLFGLASSFREVDLRGAYSMKEVVERVWKFQNENNLSVIRGFGWDQNLWEDDAMPTNDLLNEFFPDVPVLLRRIDGHSMLVNDLVLAKNNISAKSHIEGGDILLNESGLPGGVLVDNAMDLVTWPGVNDDDWTKALVDAQRFCYAKGLTGLSDMGLPWNRIQILDSLYRNGTLHIGLQVFASDDSLTFEKVLGNGFWKQERLSLTGFKFYADGALGSRGACLLLPYADATTKGFLLRDPASLEARAQRVRDAGLQLATHAIGDSANRVMLDIYLRILGTDTNHRWRIEHAQVVHNDDVEKFRGTGIIPSVQPTHGTSDMLWAVSRLGKIRLRDAYRYEDLRKAAGILALGTDFPIEPVDPLGTFISAVVRQNEDAVPPEGFQMENALSPMHTLLGMTRWAAYAQFREHEVGSIEAGKFADFVVLDVDLLNATAEELRKAYIHQTYSKGKKVYALF